MPTRPVHPGLDDHHRLRRNTSSLSRSHTPLKFVEPLVAATGVGLADKPRRRWYARDDLAVAPFVVRTGVN